MSSYTFSIIFLKENSLWLIFESIRALEIKTSMLFNLVFPKNTILSCFFFIFIIIDFYFTIPAVIAQIFNLVAEFVIYIGQPSEKKKQKLKHIKKLQS